MNGIWEYRRGMKRDRRRGFHFRDTENIIEGGKKTEEMGNIPK